MWLFFDIVPVCALAKLAKLKFIPPPKKKMKFLATPLSNTTLRYLTRVIYVMLHIRIYLSYSMLS